MPAKSNTKLLSVAAKAIYAPPEERFLLLPEVVRVTGKSRASIYVDMASGTFPLSVPIGKRRRGWVYSEIQAWIHDQIAAARTGLQESPKSARNENGTFASATADRAAS